MRKLVLENLPFQRAPLDFGWFGLAGLTTFLG